MWNQEQDAMVVCSTGYRCFRLMNQQQNMRQDGGASEAIQELRDAIDDVRGPPLRVCGVGDRTWPHKF
nr:hypothetical protein [Tanacetum cinerariifolium]